MPFIQGHLLVASPKLGDPNFFRAVVLLVRHNEEGALGLVLNRPSDTLLKEVWDNVSDSPCETSAVIHHGGPCPGPLMAMHTEEFLAESEILPNLYFATDKEKLQNLVLRPTESARFYAGYSGWQAGQLEAEMEAGAWFNSPATQQHAFWPSDDLWEQVCRELSATTRLVGIKLKHEPPDPSMN